MKLQIKKLSFPLDELFSPKELPYEEFKIKNNQNKMTVTSDNNHGFCWRDLL